MRELEPDRRRRPLTVTPRVCNNSQNSTQYDRLSLTPCQCCMSVALFTILVYFESSFKILLLESIFRVIQIPFGKIKYTAYANYFGRQRTFLSQRTYIRFSKFQIFQKFHNFQIYSFLLIC